MFHHNRPLCGRGFHAVAWGMFAGFAVGSVFAHLKLHQIRRINARVTRRTEPPRGIADRSAQRRERNIAQRIGAQELADFFGRVRGGDQFLARGRVHAVVARRNRRRATDAHVDFFCADLADHADDLAAGGATDDEIVDQNHALAFEQATNGIELELHAEITNSLRRLDEGAADVMIANQAHAEGNFRFKRVADSCRHAGIWHGNDNVGVDRMFLCEEAAEHLAAFVYGAAKNNAVRAGEIDMLENALLELFFRGEVNGLDAGFGDAHHFTGFDLADVLGVQEIEGAGFGSYQPRNEAARRSQFSKHQWTETARIADGVQLVLREHEKGIGAFDLIERIADRTGKIARLRTRNQMNDDFGVAVGLEDRAAMLELAAPFGGVGEIAVVAEGDFAFVAVDHDGLGVEQRFVAGSGVARVADGEAARELREHAGLENFFDFAHGAMDVQLFAVARDDAGGFLAAMLQRVEAEVGEVGGFRMAKDTEDTTLVVKMIVGEGEFLTHFAASVLSSEWPQASRRISMGLSITMRPLCSMRKASLWVTWPSSRTATWDCHAVLRTAASFDGVTETTARAPRSLKRADSAGSPSSRMTFAPRAGGASSAPTEAKQDSARVTARPPSEISWADCTAPSAASAMRQSWRRFSAPRSMEGGSPATMAAIALEYSEEENSRASPVGAGLAPRADDPRVGPTPKPSSKTMTSPSSRKAILRTREASSRMPRTPMTGVG